MFRQDIFKSDAVNNAQYNQIVELIAFDVDKGKNVFLHGKKGSGKSKLVDIISLMSEKELVTIAKRLILSSDSDQREMIQKTLGMLLATNKVFGRSFKLKQEVENVQSKHTDESKKNFASQLKSATNITKTEDAREKISAKMNEISKGIYDFKPEELSDLEEPYKSVYEAYRTYFKDFFFVSLRLDSFIGEQTRANFSDMVSILLNTINILPYKKRYVFLVDNFDGFSSTFINDLLDTITEWNSQGIQFIFVSDNLPPRVENKDKELNISLREINNSDCEDVFSFEIIESFISKGDAFGKWLGKNKDNVIQTIEGLRKNKVFSLAEPGNTELFLMNVKQKFLEEQLETTAFTTKTAKIDLGKMMNGDAKKFDFKHFINTNYKTDSKKHLLTKAELVKGFEEISKEIFGQDKQIKQLMSGIYQKTALAEKPRGVYMLLGPTGVGKTESVKQITRIMYGDVDKHLLIIPMEQYTDLSKLNILQGAPAGFVGYGQGENLADKLLKMKEGIILFDEIEKASPEVIKALLTTLEEGKLQMGNGEVADLKNYSILFTSNAIVSVEEVAKSKSKSTKAPRTTKDVKELTDEEIRVLCLDYLKEEHGKKFLPEFLGRINACIVYNGLTEDQLVAVMVKTLANIKQKYMNIFNEESGIALEDVLATVELSQEEQYNIIKETLNTKMGARYLIKRVDETIMNHQTKLFGIDSNKPMEVPPVIAKSDYEKYLEIKKQKEKENDMRIISKDRIASVFKAIISKIYGQDDAIKSILIGISTAYVENKKPRGVHMLIGPTGVGKTETAKQIAKEFYGSEKNLIVIPMNEYTSEVDINKLKGAPAGFVGHETARTLKDRVDEIHGGGVLLIDEIEKAHPKIVQALLGLMDEGRMEMQEAGLYADLSNFVILMTTNAITDFEGAFERYKKAKSGKKTIGFDTTTADEKTKLEKFDVDTYEGKVNFIIDCLKGKIDDEAISGNTFSPEFLGRIDGFHYYRGFYEATDDNIYQKIVEKWVKEREEEMEKEDTGMVDISKEKRMSFIHHTDDELHSIWVEVQDSKLGIRAFIKKLNELKNKKIQDFLNEYMTN